MSKLTGKRWSRCALEGLAADNVYMVQTSLQMPGADIAEGVVGYSRYGSYNRTKLIDFQDKIPNRTPGDTILHLAVRNSKPFCVSKLISLGASVIAQNDIGETPLDVAKHLKDSGDDPNMAPLFRGIAIELPTGAHVTYAEKELKFIKESLTKHSSTDSLKTMEQRLMVTEMDAKNHERARENAIARLKHVRKEKDHLSQQLVETDALRAHMQTKRDAAESACHVMQGQVREMEQLRQQLAQAEDARLDAEERLHDETMRRQQAEKEREEALALAQKMRKERDLALQKAVATNERLKDGVGCALTLSMSQTTEQSRLQQAMQDLEERVLQKEREVANLVQTQTGGKSKSKSKSKGLGASRSTPASMALTMEHPSRIDSASSTSMSSSVSGAAVGGAVLTVTGTPTQQQLDDLNASAMSRVLSLGRNRNGPE